MEIHFEIENKCLLKCRHCSSSALPFGMEKKYSDKSVVGLLKKLKGRKEIFLTGGEPLLYPKLDLLLQQLHAFGDEVMIGMFTTGIVQNGAVREAVSEEYARLLADHGLKVCYVSVYSTQKEKHDWMTCCSGSFELIKTSVRHFRKAGIEVRFNTVVTAKNQNEIPDMIEMAGEWGASEVRLLKLVCHGRAENCWEEIGLTEEAYRTIVLNVLKEEASVRISASGIVDVVPCRAFCDTMVCPAGRELLYVTYTGDMYPCASVKNQKQYKIGNIDEENIEEKYQLFCGRLQEAMLCKKEVL